MGGAGIEIYGYSMNLIPHPVLGANIYSNTILMGSTVGSDVWITGITPAAAGYCTANFLNNLFYNSTGGPLVNCSFYAPALTNITFEANDYFTAGGGSNFNLSWGSISYTSIGSWRNATQEETIGGVPVGENADPLLVNETVSDLQSSSIANLKLSINSPLRGAGQDLSAYPLVNSAPYTNYSPYNLAGTAWNGTGGVDYFGDSVVHGGSHDIGADQASSLVINGSAAGDSFYIQSDPYNAYSMDVNQSAYSLNGVMSVVINGAAGNENVTFDFANGPLSNGSGPLAQFGVTFNAGNAGNTLSVVNTGAMAGGAMPVVYAPGVGVSNNLNANYGLITVAAGTNTQINTATFSNITIGSGAEVAIANTSIDRTARTLVVITGSLSLAGSTNAWTGTLDLADNDMDLKTADLGTIENHILQGWNDRWQSSGGIISSAAASDSTNLTALGVIQNSITGSPSSPLYDTFDLATVASTDILIKFTYVGDANLDGIVNGSDYSLIDNGYLQSLSGWFNGDFNYDGAVDGSDYTLIDNAFNTQGATLAAQVATSKADEAPAPLPDSAVNLDNSDIANSQEWFGCWKRSRRCHVVSVSGLVASAIKFAFESRF
jgi:hypothetical protein